MPAPHPREFRDDVVAVARRGEPPIAQIATDFGISDSCLRNWRAKDDIEAGIRFFTDWDPNNRPDGTIDHAMVIDGFANDGNPLISQKTPNRHHIKLSRVYQNMADEDRQGNFYWLKRN